MSAATGEVVIYGSTSPAYLLSCMFPEAARVASHLGEGVDDLLERLPSSPGWFIFHVNLTDSRNVPWGRERLVDRLAEGGARLVNARVTDISKRAVQEHCTRVGLPSTLACRGGDPDERVIVKTDRNCGGIGERILRPEQRERIGLEIGSTDAWTKEYPILARRDVTPATWSSPDFIVERYVANARNHFFRAYRFGAHLVVTRVTDPEPLKRMPEGIPRTDFLYTLDDGEPRLRGGAGGEPPERLAREVAHFCRTFHLDFGALDVVCDDEGRHYVVDVNSTPVWGGTGHPELVEFLAAGAR